MNSLSEIILKVPELWKSLAWTSLANQNKMIRKFMEDNERLSAKLIGDHEEVIFRCDHTKIVFFGTTGMLEFTLYYSIFIAVYSS